jgi:excinuclease ABC subunit C
MNINDKIEKLAQKEIPTLPGVYIFLDEKGKTLYVGKAKNLRSRIKSYFLRVEELRKSRSEAISQMVGKINQIKTYPVDSEIEAILLESELINKQKPKYNSRQKDDKSFYLIKIDKKSYPSVQLIRSRNVDLRNKNAIYFGPYYSGDLVKRALKMLRKIFPFANCSQAKFSRQTKLERACLYGDLNLCLSPCTNVESENLEQLGFLVDFLRGNKRKIIKNLEKKMSDLSKEEKYEEAKILRDKIFALEHLNRYPVGIKDSFFDFQNFAHFPRIEAYDISNIGGDFAVGAMTVASLGKIDKKEYKKFKIKTVREQNDIAMTVEVIKRRLKNNWPRSNLIVIDGGVAHLKSVLAILSKTDTKIPIVSIAKGFDRKKNEFYYSSSDLAKYFEGNHDLRKLIIQLRDEAHRFSIEYYRKLHRKSISK